MNARICSARDHLAAAFLSAFTFACSVLIGLEARK